MEEIAQWARWVVTACLVLAVVGLIVLTVVWWNDSNREAQSQTQWDEVYKALKDKNKPEEQIPALESVAGKVKGTAAHAYVLMRLGNLYFKEGTNPAKSKEDQVKALSNAKSSFDLIATQEPYANNKTSMGQTFAPFALEGEALVLEQQQDYDGAIKLLDEKLKDWESHPLYSKMSAQLGRLYYLRSLKRENKADKDKDCELARAKLSEVLRPFDSINSKTPDGDIPPEYRSAWREQADYIRSLVSGFGKALPDGKAPPVKQPPAPVPPPGATAPVPPVTPTPATPARAADTKSEPKKEEPKKDDTKPAEKK
jgi:tetratricopeptide (TPR) repeat protein